MYSLSTIIRENKCKNIDNEKPKRKRQRLDHLSQEEKLMRRKLKNRVAAQSARDRKKVKMQDLEEYCLLLDKQKNALALTNQSLKLKNSLLKEENKELKRRLGLINENMITSDIVSDCSQLNDTIESAEFINEPQLKEQALNQLRRSEAIALPLIMLFVYLSTIRTQFSICYTSVLMNCLIQTSVKTTNNYNNNYRHQWWGPHQRSWNPSII